MPKSTTLNERKTNKQSSEAYPDRVRATPVTKQACNGVGTQQLGPGSQTSINSNTLLVDPTVLVEPIASCEKLLAGLAQSIHSLESTLKATRAQLSELQKRQQQGLRDYHNSQAPMPEEPAALVADLNILQEQIAQAQQTIDNLVTMLEIKRAELEKQRVQLELLRTLISKNNPVDAAVLMLRVDQCVKKVGRSRPVGGGCLAT